MTWQGLPRHRPWCGTVAPSPMVQQDLDTDRRSAAVGEDQQRRDHGPLLCVAAERHLQLRPQHLHLPRPLAGGLRAGALVDMRSRSTVDYCAYNEGVFFGDFLAAMTKLGRIRVKTPDTGVEIRRDCRFPN